MTKLLENTLSAIITLDLSGKILSANAAALRLFGYEEDITGRPIRMLLPDYTGNNSEFGSLTILMNQIDISNTIEITAIRKDDTELPVEVILSKSDDKYLCQIRDISRKQMTENLDAILHATLRKVMRGQSAEEFSKYICDKLVDLFGFPLSWIGIKENNGLVRVCACAGELSKGFPAHPIRWDDVSEKFGPTGNAIRTKRPVVIELADDKIVDVDGREHIHQISVFPLITHQGVEGVLEIHSRLGKLDNATIQRLETFSLRIAMAMQMAHDQNTMRLQRTALEKSPNGFALTDDKGILLWVNPSFCELSGYSNEELIGKKIQQTENETQTKEFYNDMWETLRSGKNWSSEITERNRTGALYTVSQRVIPITDEKGALNNCVFVREDLTEQKHAEGVITQLVNFDQLTGLPNRASFHQQLANVLKRASLKDKKVAVLFIDLMNFNRINDTLGHVSGDNLLKNVAERLLKLASVKDFVARIGGDEFAIISENIRSAEAVAIKARNLIEAILSPIVINDTEVNVGACIGISIYPDDDQDPDKIVNYADMALRTATHSAPNSYFFFSQEMNEETEDKLELERDLRRALVQNEFAVYFQPQLDLKTGKILSAEALVRWMHPTRGMISPMKFIPIAEDTGLIIPLGNWVLKEALRQVKLWDSMGLPKISVAVNLSAVQFQQEDLVGVVESALKEFNMPADRLELELTESVVMQDANKTGNILSRLSSTGIKLAIDDFGTGYSSLSYLKRFDVDRLKIDQSFVRDMANNCDDAEIAHAIINLGHTLGLEIVSEGVETINQLELLEKQGCDVIQGYLISKPIPASEVPTFLQKKSFY
ncbi:MAG: EAL domain-containing protein [Alphaproteobacteria bacterium]|nr:EAL domain-containing protein [Alphaproteobacteria bacterium]